MFDRFVGGGNFGALERVIQFTSARHGVIANNIANIETPGFRPSDLSTNDFQASLAEAIANRQTALRSGVGIDRVTASDGGLQMSAADSFRLGANGLEATPVPMDDGILFHDGNDRNLERILQGMTENLLMFRFAATMVRRHFNGIDTAIRERL